MQCEVLVICFMFCVSYVDSYVGVYIITYTCTCACVCVVLDTHNIIVMKICQPAILTRAATTDPPPLSFEAPLRTVKASVYL